MLGAGIGLGGGAPGPAKASKAGGGGGVDAGSVEGLEGAPPPGAGGGRLFSLPLLPLFLCYFL